MAHSLLNFKQMKKNVYLLVMLTCLFIAACTGGSRKETKSFHDSLDSNDTLAMISLADSCMTLLKGSQIDYALDMLQAYNDSTHSISPLSEEQRAIYRNKFSMFPVLSYERVYYSFQKDGCNDVKYSVVFAEDPNNGPAKTSYMFNPVKIDGLWYLTVKTSGQDINMNRR